MSERPGGPAPEFEEHPGYGLWPCSNSWHTTMKPYVYGESPGECPDCPNTWWAADGSGCPEEYALLAEIDWLRERVARTESGERFANLVEELRNAEIGVDGFLHELGLLTASALAQPEATR